MRNINFTTEASERRADQWGTSARPCVVGVEVWTAGSGPVASYKVALRDYCSLLCFSGSSPSVLKGNSKTHHVDRVLLIPFHLLLLPIHLLLLPLPLILLGYFDLCIREVLRNRLSSPQGVSVQLPLILQTVVNTKRLLFIQCTKYHTQYSTYLRVL